MVKMEGSSVTLEISRVAFDFNEILAMIPY